MNDVLADGAELQRVDSLERDRASFRLQARRGPGSPREGRGIDDVEPGLER